MVHELSTVNMPLPEHDPQPFVKWVGGKRSLLSEIHARLPRKFGNYYEPFVGGGAVFFSLSDRLERAFLSDHNLELVITYNVIKREPENLIRQLKEHARDHGKEYYYHVRSLPEEDPVKKAARFIYLNKTCYNGLYRVNRAGKFNTPMGSYKNPNIVQEETILACHRALQKAEISWYDFEKIEPERGDFVYIDPPYHPTDEVSFTEYTKNNFTEKDQERLRDFAVKLHKAGVQVMLSNSSTQFVRDLYKNRFFQHHAVQAPRFVNCKPDRRGAVDELIITNY